MTNRTYTKPCSTPKFYFDNKRRTKLLWKVTGNRSKYIERWRWTKHAASRSSHLNLIEIKEKWFQRGLRHRRDTDFHLWWMKDTWSTPRSCIIWRRVEHFGRKQDVLYTSILLLCWCIFATEEDDNSAPTRKNKKRGKIKPQDKINQSRSKGSYQLATTPEQKFPMWMNAHIIPTWLNIILLKNDVLFYCFK